MNPNEEVNAADVTRLFKNIFKCMQARRDYIEIISSQLFKNLKSRARRDSGFAKFEAKAAK